MNEQEMERVARGLGTEAAERLEVEPVVAAVLARLRTNEPAAALRRRWPAAGPGARALRIAAALAVLVGGGLIARGALERGGSAPPDVPAPVLVGLSSDELEEVFDSLVVEAPVHEFAAGGLESLNTTQLAELLQQMEG